MITSQPLVQAISVLDDVASWNRPRSVVELRAFVNDHEEALDVDDFDL